MSTPCFPSSLIINYLLLKKYQTKIRANMKKNYLFFYDSCFKIFQAPTRKRQTN